MAGMNKVILLGNVGQEPETRHTRGGSFVLSLRLATTTSSWNSKEQKRVEDTQWHTAVVFGPRAEALGKVIQMGSQVMIEGKISYKTWEDKQGNKRYSTEIIADEVELVGGRPGQRRGYDRQEHQGDDLGTGQALQDDPFGEPGGNRQDLLGNNPGDDGFTPF